MSDMRKLIEAVEPKEEIVEGKYGPHGFGRRVNDEVDAVFDKHLDRLGTDPTVEEIYDAMKNVRRDLAADGNMGFPRTNSYINKQFLGLVAETLELPGLYSPSGKVFYSVTKDEAGRYTGSGGASKRTAEELAEKGYLSQEAAERLGVTSFLGMQFGDNDSDEANATRNAQTMASGRRQVRRDAARFMELLAKRNASANESVAYRSALARLLTEALDDAEEAEFQELLSKIKLLNADDYEDEETKNAVAQAREAADAIEPQADDAGDDTGNAPTDSGEDDANSRDSGGDSGDPNSRDSGTDSVMSLADFAKSDKGGLKNDTNETRAITELQEFLKTMGWDVGIDGRYGPQTTSAVKEFQQLTSLTDDGDAGPQTIEKMLVWGKLPDVKTWAAQAKELSDLIAAGAVFRAPAAESVVHSIRSMINLVESLFEEVTDQQQARAMELYNELKTKIDGDGEYMAALPEVLRTQLTTAADWARNSEGVGADGDADAETDVNALDAAAKAAGIFRGLDGAGTDEESVVAIMGSIANAQELEAVETVFRELSGGTELKDWLDSDTSNWFDNEDTQQQVDDIYNRLTGGDEDPGSLEAVANATDAADALNSAMKDGWLFGLGTEEQAVLGILGKITTGSWPNVKQLYQTRHGSDLMQDFESEFSGQDLANLNTALERLGERVGPEVIPNGAAPEAEQEDDYVVVYWEGTKFYINPTKGADGVYRGGTTKGNESARATDPELIRAIEAEIARRGGTANPDQQTSDGGNAEDNMPNGA